MSGSSQFNLVLFLLKVFRTINSVVAIAHILVLFWLVPVLRTNLLVEQLHLACNKPVQIKQKDTILDDLG